MSPVALPQVFWEADVSLAVIVDRFLPEQGGIELQHDRPGRRHDWHSHDVHETLVVLSGAMELEFVAGDTIATAEAGTNSRIELPRDTVHRSTARASGCYYVIVPENGRVAVTTRYSDPIGGTIVV